MEFSKVVKERYSCKKFDGRKISKEQLDAILEAGPPGPHGKKSSGTENLCDSVGGGTG